MKPPCHKVIRSIICCLCLCGNSPLCFSQPTGYDFSKIETIGTKQGLSNNSAWSLLQDSRGFIWIATEYGLNRYDGYNIKVYNYDPSDSNSISPGWYSSLLEGTNGLIWFSTSSNGFYSFDPISEKFTRYYHQPGNSNSLAGEIHNGNITIDIPGTLWISTAAGLNSFDPVEKRFALFKHIEHDASSLSSNSILWVCADDENNIWAITSANTLEIFNIRNKKVTGRFTIGSEEMPGDKNKPELYSIYKGRSGNMWIGSKNNGLYCYNTKTKGWRHFTGEPENKILFNENGSNYCYEDEGGNVLLSPTVKGFCYLETLSGKFHYLDQIKTGINSIIKSRDGKIWIASSDEGVYTCVPENKKIRVIKLNPEENKPRNSKLAIDFYPFHKNELLISGENGAYLFNTVTENLERFKIIENGRDIFANNITWMTRQDSKGNFWFCTLNGLALYDPKTKIHRYFRTDVNDPGSLNTASIPSVIEDDNGKLWITTFGGGLELYDPLRDVFKAYKVNDKRNPANVNYLVGGFKASNGILYIGSWDGGLIQFNPSTEIFRIFRHRPSDPNTISSNIAIPLYEDKNGFIWIGTLGGGLNVFDPSTELFRTFTMQDGLPSNAIVSMARDNDGKSWIGTYHGIACFSLPQNPFDKNAKINFRNYDISDGLPSNDLTILGAYKDDDGRLYFSTATNGFFYFDPKEWQDNRVTPPVYITGISLMNQPVNVGDSGSILKIPMEFTKEIKLNYRQNILSFSFTALNYIHPERNQYAYKLEKYDKNWIIGDASRAFANYTNLAPGNYVFKVKASNNDGVWNETPAELKISISPPFWQTSWFKLLVAVAVTATLYTFYRYRIGQIEVAL